MNKKRNVLILIIFLCMFFIGFLKINIEVTKILGVNNNAPIKIYYEKSPVSLKIELRKYNIELSKKVFKELIAKYKKN